MTILVVEDETDVAELIQRALEELGNSCLHARTAEQADVLLTRHDVDAVTLDLGIPDRTGLDWLECVADTRPELAQKTLVITGQQLEPDSVERVTRCGAGFLAKPFTLDDLGEAVRSQLDWAHRQGTTFD